MKPEGRARAVAALGIVSLLTAAACGGPTPPPGPGTVSGYPPDLRGRRVLVLPVQQVLGVRGDADAELAFGLRGRGARVEWIFPDEVDEVLARSPGLLADTRGLPVGQFLQAEVRRVGDPLFGQLRRLSALVDAEAVLLPVQASVEAQPASDPTVRFWTALIEARTGRMLWFSVLDGAPFRPEDPRGLATAVDVVARSLLPYAGA